VSALNLERLDRLDRLIAEGRVIRHKWTDKDAAGRELACLLAALSPEVGPGGDVEACPASVMPLWLAKITPILDDRGTALAWPGMVRRYASLARRWHVVDEEGWLRAQYGACAAITREAMARAKQQEVIDVCREVADLCDRRASGEPELGHRLAVARTRALALRSKCWAAASEAAAATAEAAAAAAAERAAAAEAAAASEAASEAAAEAAEAAAEAEAEAEVPYWSPKYVKIRQRAREALNDRIATVVLNAIEKAIVDAEARAA
jgi:hypothetical protein